MNPFPNIAFHVVKSPCVGFFLSDGMRFVFRISRVPGDVVKLARVGPRAAGTCRIFPLGFCRQTVTIPVVPRIQHVQEFLRLADAAWVTSYFPISKVLVILTRWEGFSSLLQA